MADQPVITFIDNPHAPEVLSTGHAGLWIHEGNVHITLEAARVNHNASPGPINRVVVARLVLPMQAAKNLAGHITAMLDNPAAPAPTPPGTALH